MNEIKLIAPVPVGSEGAEPDGNKKYVLKPTVEIPELIILTVCDSPSAPPEQVTVTIPVAVTLWSCADVRFSVVTIPDDTSASVVIPDPPPPAAIVIVETPDDGTVAVSPLWTKFIVVAPEPIYTPPD